MKFRNPARHYPSYLCHVHFKDRDRKPINVRGSSSFELDLPVEDAEVLVVVVKILDASRHVKMTQLLVDGEWSDYSEMALEDILSPPMTMPKPDPKPKSKIRKFPTPKYAPPATTLGGKTGVTVAKGTDKE